MMPIARFLRQTHHTRNMPKNNPTITNTSGRCHACQPKVVTIPKFTPIGAQTARLRMRSLRGRLASWGLATNHTMKAPQSPPHKRTDSHWLAVPMPFSRPSKLRLDLTPRLAEQSDYMFDWRRSGVSTSFRRLFARFPRFWSGFFHRFPNPSSAR